MNKKLIKEDVEIYPLDLLFNDLQTGINGMVQIIKDVPEEATDYEQKAPELKRAIEALTNASIELVIAKSYLK